MSDKKPLLNEDNAQAMLLLLGDPETPPDIKVKIMNRLIDTRGGDNFFPTMLAEMVSYGKCPCCEHENHWLVPEDELNKMGWVSEDRDHRIAEQTRGSCPQFEEACTKRKTYV